MWIDTTQECFALALLLLLSSVELYLLIVFLIFKGLFYMCKSIWHLDSKYFCEDT